MENQQQTSTPQSVLDRQAMLKDKILKHLENGWYFRDTCLSVGIGIRRQDAGRICGNILIRIITADPTDATVQRS